MGGDRAEAQIVVSDRRMPILCRQFKSRGKSNPPTKVPARLREQAQGSLEVHHLESGGLDGDKCLSLFNCRRKRIERA